MPPIKFLFNFLNLFGTALLSFLTCALKQLRSALSTSTAALLEIFITLLQHYLVLSDSKSRELSGELELELFDFSPSTPIAINNILCAFPCSLRSLFKELLHCGGKFWHSFSFLYCIKCIIRHFLHPMEKRCASPSTLLGLSGDQLF